MKTAHCLCVTVLAFSVGACVKPVPIEDGMPCPCADGYVCCATQCTVGQVCPAPDGGTSDVAIGDAGQSKWQPIASVSVNNWTAASGPFLMGDRVAFWDAFNNGRSATYRFAQNDWLQQEGYWPGQRFVAGAGLVWTGSQVVYWGGVVDTMNANDDYKCNSRGGVYYPATDTWSAINTTGVPSLAVDGGGYTGKEVVIRGNSCVPQPSGSDVRGPVIGALYDPATDTWRGMSSVNAPTSTNGTDVVLGAKVVCWGGAPYVEGQTYAGPTNQSGWTNSGAVYNVVDDTWTPMSTTNAPSPRSAMVALAMRGKLFIWGGTDETTNSLGEQSYFRDGGIFDPETNTWTSISRDGSPNPAVNNGLWAEEQGLVYVWAFIWTPGAGFPDVALWTYDPSADRWAPIDVTGLPEMKSTYFVWTGQELLALGNMSYQPEILGGYRYTP